MKRTIIILALLVLAATSSVFAYGSTKVVQLHVVPEIQKVTISDQKTIVLNVKADIMANFNFGYKESLGFFMDLGAGAQLYEIDETSYSKKSDYTYDLMIGLSYMAKSKRNNNIFGLIAIGPVVKRPVNPASNNLLDFTLGVALYADVETLINTGFLTFGTRLGYNFFEIYSNSGKTEALKKSGMDIGIYFGIGFDWNR